MSGENNSTVHVSDLHQSIDANSLSKIFKQFGQLKSCQINLRCQRNKPNTAYVMYETNEEASHAVAEGNMMEIYGTKCRVTIFDNEHLNENDPHLCATKMCKSIDEASLKLMLENFVPVKLCSISLDANCESKGYGFITLENEIDIARLIDQIEKSDLSTKFSLSAYNSSIKTEKQFTNLFVKNFDILFNNDTLKEKFETYGEVLSAKVVVDENNVSKGFGFVNFKSAEDGQKACEVMHKSIIEGRQLFVGRAMSKYELKKTTLHDDIKTNLYIKNLHESVTDEDLREKFSEFGTVKSAKVMMNSEGISRQFGFVSFNNESEAESAINNVNMTFYKEKLVHMAYAKSKTERLNQVQSDMLNMIQSYQPTVFPNQIAQEYMMYNNHPILHQFAHMQLSN